MKKLVLFLFFIAAVACSKDDDNSNGNGNPNVLPPMTDKEDVCTAMDDLIFMKYCYDNFDVNKDGKVSPSEANAVQEIRVPGMGIHSLKGIEYFSNLKVLDAKGYSSSSSYNNISTINLAFNLELVELNLDSNYSLSQLDISNNKKITNLKCQGNQLSQLDVSKNLNLSSLYCSGNQLSQLDVSKNLKLSSLGCYNNQLSHLDISKNENMVFLDCSGNDLRYLNLGNYDVLGVYYNTLEISTNAEYLEIIGSKITHISIDNHNVNILDLSKCSSLKSLSIKYNVNNNIIPSIELVYLPKGSAISLYTKIEDYEYPTVYPGIPDNIKIEYK